MHAAAKIHRSVEGLPGAPGGRSVALGTFDGVHLGHRRVIESALRWGRAHDARAAVVTFDPHPLQVLRPEDPPGLLTSTDVKVDLLASLGVDEVIVVPFTEELSRVEPDDFVEDVLVRALGARHVSVGENFRFGHRAAGDAQLLQSHEDLDTEVVPLVEHGGEAVSSSRIRDLVAKGDVEAAAELLGGPFQLEGKVVRGDGRGRELGMPTANLEPPEGMVLPAPGVYAARALGRPAAVNIGVRPTFERDGALVVEAYLLDFEGELYGRALRLEFVARLRDEVRFDSPEALVEQMHRDVARVRDLA